LSGAVVFAEAMVPIVAAGWLALAVLAGRAFAEARRNAQAVSIELSAPQALVRGEEFDVAYTLRNARDKEVRAEIAPRLPPGAEPEVWRGKASVPSRGRVALRPRLRAPVRGRYEFGPVQLRVADRFRLVQTQVELPASQTCSVYPDYKRVKDYIIARRLRTSMAPAVRTARLRGIGSDFESLRDYEEGDDIRRIDWKATARFGKLITRNYEIEQHRNVMIVVDRGRLMAGRARFEGVEDEETTAGVETTKLDCAVDAALMLAGVSLEAGDRCGVMVFGHDVTRFLPPRAGLGQLERVLEQIYDVQPALVETHFRRAFMFLRQRVTTRSLVVVLSDVTDPETSRALMTGMAALSRQHLVVFCALRTPELERVLEDGKPGKERLFQRAVTYRMMQGRAEVMAGLDKSGVHVLDTRPDELTVPLINKYVELREANRL
jgi:uncharacterized protein (DUF58 family)